MSSPVVEAADHIWRGVGAIANDTLKGTTEFNDIDTTIFQEAIDPLERLLKDYREGAQLTYNSGATLRITPGQIACQNAAGTRVLFSESTANIDATFAANLDTGSEANSTTYYVYGIGSLTSGTFTIKFSTSSSAPTGSTYFVKLGSFYNNSSGDIEQVFNEDNAMIVSSGTVAHGGTIPVPSGYSQDECDWIVSLGELDDTGINGAFNDVNCTASSSRVVTCTANNSNWVDGQTDTTITGTANYLIFCIQ